VRRNTAASRNGVNLLVRDSLDVAEAVIALKKQKVFSEYASRWFLFVAIAPRLARTAWMVYERLKDRATTCLVPPRNTSHR
jgi:hypothetical protein